MGKEGGGTSRIILLYHTGENRYPGSSYCVSFMCKSSISKSLDPDFVNALTSGWKCSNFDIQLLTKLLYESYTQNLPYPSPPSERGIKGVFSSTLKTK
jgi:hypothetical protein